MTLLIVGVSAPRAAVGADRQVSFLAPGGGYRPDDTAFPKVGLVRFRNARAAFGFAGLAEAGHRPVLPPLSKLDALVPRPPPSKYGELARPFNMRREIMGALLDAGKDDQGLDAVVSKLPALLTSVVKKSPASGLATGLTVVIAGYRYQGPANAPRAFYVVVSNTDVDGDELPERPHLPRPSFECAGRGQDTDEIDGGHLLAFGNVRPAAKAHGEGIGALLDDPDRPSEAVAYKVMDVIRHIAQAEPLAGIGTSATTVVIPADFSSEPFVFHAPGEPRSEEFGVALVDLPRGVAIDEPRSTTLTEEGDPVIAVVPRVGRNAPCPCGSGMKFKRCHGQ